MDFGLNEEQRLAVNSLRRFLDKEIRPYGQQYRDEPIPKDLTHELLQKLIPYGFLVGPIGEENGGLALDYVTQGLLYEELMRVFPGLAGTACISELTAVDIAITGTDDQQDRYLHKLMSGELIGCLAISEPDVGSNPAAMRTKAEPEGDGYRINGQKAWISNGDVSDLCLVVVRTGGDDPKRSLSRFVVEREPDGYTARDVPKLGLNSWSTAELYFDDTFVPAGNLVGELGTGLKSTLELFERARCFMGLFSVALGQEALDASIQYAQERRQWGKRIGEHQLIQNLIAEMATELDCARLLTYRALSLLDQGVRCDTQTTMAKYYATEAGVRITSKAIEIHGAYGLTKEFPLEQYFRDARVMTIPDGTSEIQKLIIARNLLGMAAFG
jgi:alkylation response protein AidB-like acyl-CoA dehydrogenase